VVIILPHAVARRHQKRRNLLVLTATIRPDSNGANRTPARPKRGRKRPSTPRGRRLDDVPEVVEDDQCLPDQAVLAQQRSDPGGRRVRPAVVLGAEKAQQLAE
jgi:hypothetical protein